MKNLVYLFLVFFLFSHTPSGAQNRTRTIIPASPAGAQQIVDEIMEVVGLKPNFSLQAASVPNAAAVVVKGKRYVLYNPTFINTLTRIAGNKWASVSILAHEIGHHLNGHTLEAIGSRPATEIEAEAVNDTAAPNFSMAFLHALAAGKK